MLVVAERVVVPPKLGFVLLPNGSVLSIGQIVTRANPHNASHIDPTHHVRTGSQQDIVIGRLQDEPRFVMPAAHVVVVNVDLISFWYVSRQLPSLLKRFGTASFQVEVVTVCI